MFGDYDKIDCVECGGFGIVRYSRVPGTQRLIPVYCEYCGGSGTILRTTYPTTPETTYPIEGETEADKKFRAYTAVGSMTPEQFRRLIDGRWGTRKDDLIEMTPINALSWTDGDDWNGRYGLTAEDIRRSIERSDRKAKSMNDETPYDKYVRYNRLQGNDVTAKPSDAGPRPLTAGHFARSIFAIVKQSTLVARAFIRERILVR